jgi:UDP-N-acetylglucosamine kinase
MQTTKIAEFNDQQFERAFYDAYTEAIENKLPVNTPTAYILGGQPGAGKTTLQRIIAKTEPNIIVINGDEYRKYHPNFSKLQAKFGNDSVLHTQKFSNYITETLIRQLSDEHYNLVIEGTLRTAETPLSTCKQLKNKDYNVELAVMAVNKQTSWQGTIDRYNIMKSKGETPRATPKAHHDLVVAVLPENIDKLYKSGEFDNITLYNRNGDNLYDMRKTPNQSPASILDDVLNTVKPTAISATSNMTNYAKRFQIEADNKGSNYKKKPTMATSRKLHYDTRKTRLYGK